MAIDTFINFEAQAGMMEIKGETQDEYFGTKGAGGQGRGCFELKDWSFDVSNKSTIGSATGGAGGGKAEFGEFSISKMVDSASPAFFRNCVAGAHYKTVTLMCRKAGAAPEAAGGPYLGYKFGTVFTTKVAWKHGDDGPSEDITFVYGTLEIEYKKQKPDGTLEAIKPAGWTLLGNKAFTSGAVMPAT